MSESVKFSSYTHGSVFIFSSGKRAIFAQGYYVAEDAKEIAELREAVKAHGLICEGELAYGEAEVAEPGVKQPPLPTAGTAAARAAAAAATKQ